MGPAIAWLCRRRDRGGWQHQDLRGDRGSRCLLRLIARSRPSLHRIHAWCDVKVHTCICTETIALKFHSWKKTDHGLSSLGCLLAKAVWEKMTSLLGCRRLVRRWKFVLVWRVVYR